MCDGALACASYAGVPKFAIKPSSNKATKIDYLFGNYPNICHTTNVFISICIAMFDRLPAHQLMKMHFRYITSVRAYDYLAPFQSLQANAV